MSEIPYESITYYRLVYDLKPKLRKTTKKNEILITIMHNTPLILYVFYPNFKMLHDVYEWMKKKVYKVNYKNLIQILCKLYC